MSTAPELLRWALRFIPEENVLLRQEVNAFLNEPEAETIETLIAENSLLAAGQCTEGGPWGDEGGSQYCKYTRPEPAKKPMTEEEAIELCPFTREEFKAGFLTGVRFAEKHHGIGEH
jgi:hypothetical protein